MSQELKIFIIDDMESMRQIIKYNLEHFGYQNIHDSDDPIQSLQQIKEAYGENKAYELIICDLTMPKLGGIELVQQLRKDDSFRTLPILMVLADSDRRRADEIINNGASGYIVKPFTKEQLKEKLDQILH